MSFPNNSQWWGWCRNPSQNMPESDCIIAELTIAHLVVQFNQESASMNMGLSNLPTKRLRMSMWLRKMWGTHGQQRKVTIWTLLWNNCGTPTYLRPRMPQWVQPATGDSRSSAMIHSQSEASTEPIFHRRFTSNPFLWTFITPLQTIHDHFHEPRLHHQ